MVSVTALIDKLTDIELSIGIESHSTIRHQVIEAQDCALLIQREVAEILCGGPPMVCVAILAGVQ